MLTLKALEPVPELFQAGDGASAMALINEEDFDLVLLDFHLPDTTGAALLRQLKEISPEVPAVIMSGSEEPALIRSALDAGSSGFFPKSLDPEHLLDAVNLVLKGEIYVPPSIADKLSTQGPCLTSEKGFDFSDLVQMAQVTQQVIETSDWSIRAKQEGANRPETVEAFNSLLEKMEAQYSLLREHAFKDPLTGLPNRRLFNDRLEQALSFAKRNRKLMALVAIDLDKFKQINDSLGHDQGDVLLKRIAERLEKLTREVDTVSRLGGDEFVVILTELDDKAALLVAVKRLFEGLTRAVQLDGEMLTPGISMGVALSDGSCGPDMLFKRADEALYDVKHGGRNGYRVV